MRTWLKEQRTRKMSATEAAWLAGFFDGEGSLIGYKRKGKDFVGWRISIGNTSLPALERCKAYTNVGTIGSKRVLPNPKHNPQWLWQVNGQRDIVDLLKQMLPYLLIKKEKAESFLNNWEDLPSTAMKQRVSG